MVVADVVASVGVVVGIVAALLQVRGHMCGVGVVIFRDMVAVVLEGQTCSYWWLAYFGTVQVEYQLCWEVACATVAGGGQRGEEVVDDGVAVGESAVADDVVAQHC